MEDDILDTVQRILEPGRQRGATKAQLRTVFAELDALLAKQVRTSVNSKALLVDHDYAVGDFLVRASDDGQNLRVQTHTNRGAIQIKPETGNSIIVVNTRSSAGPRVP